MSEDHNRIQRLAAGDEDEIQYLLAECLSISKSKHYGLLLVEYKDIGLAACWKIIKSIQAGKEIKKSLEAYIYTVVDNLYKDILREQKCVVDKKTVTRLDTVYLFEKINEDQMLIDVLAVTEREAHNNKNQLKFLALEECLEILSDRYKDIVHLYMGNYSTKEISERVPGVKRESVSPLWNKIRKRLGICIEKRLDTH